MTHAGPSAARRNAAIAHAAWDAISRGDRDALEALMAPDVVWHATARGTPWSGTHRGPGAVVDFLARVGEVSDFFRASLVDVLASGERVLLVFHASFRRGGWVAELDYWLLGHIRDGRIAEMWSVPLDPATIESFWAGQKV